VLLCNVTGATADRVTESDVAGDVRPQCRYEVTGSRTADIQILLIQLEYLGSGDGGRRVNIFKGEVYLSDIEIFTFVPCILIFLSKFYYQLMHKRIALTGIIKFTLK